VTDPGDDDKKPGDDDALTPIEGVAATGLTVAVSHERGAGLSVAQGEEPASSVGTIVGGGVGALAVLGATLVALTYIWRSTGSGPLRHTRVRAEPDPTELELGPIRPRVHFGDDDDGGHARNHHVVIGEALPIVDIEGVVDASVASSSSKHAGEVEEQEVLKL